MKRASLFLAAALSCFMMAAEARPPAAAVYLDTADHANQAHSKLLAAASGGPVPSAAETHGLMEAYERSPEFQTILERYSQDLFTLLKIDPADPGEWRRREPLLALGIRNYVGDSGEGEADEGPSWMTINRKLRSGEAFTAEEASFYAPIAKMVRALPQVKGLVFRGQDMTPERFDEVPVKAGWLRKAFTSTSLSPSTAASFGYAVAPSRTAVLILKVKNGAAVSPLTFDNGAMGQPGRTDEREVLLADGATLFVHAKIEDPVNDRYYIFAEQK